MARQRRTLKTRHVLFNTSSRTYQAWRHLPPTNYMEQRSEPCKVLRLHGPLLCLLPALPLPLDFRTRRLSHCLYPLPLFRGPSIIMMSEVQLELPSFPSAFYYLEKGWAEGEIEVVHVGGVDRSIFTNSSFSVTGSYLPHDTWVSDTCSWEKIGTKPFSRPELMNGNQQTHRYQTHQERGESWRRHRHTEECST